MIAKITILDDDNMEVHGPYELQPSRELNDGSITRHIFNFEFDSLNIPFMSDNGIDICRTTNFPYSECAHKKPPLGLMPKKIYDHKRMGDIFDAMSRYSEAEKVIPIEWIDELKELVDG